MEIRLGMIPGSRNMNGKIYLVPYWPGSLRKREPPGSRHFRPERVCQFGQAKNTVILDVPARNDGVASPFRDFCRYGPVAKLSMKRWKDSMSSGTILISVYAGSACTSRNIHPEGPHSVAVRSV